MGAFHLDYDLRLHTEPEYKSLYNWAINEIGADGASIDKDQIPWPWTLCFAATSCVLTDELEIDELSPRDVVSQSIRMALRPEATYSMFGTNRTIRDFTLEIIPLSDPAEKEKCSAWGCVSYTTEIDFRNETMDDYVWFYLYIKPARFMHYVDIIDQGTLDTAVFSVGFADGFYSEWSPSVSTDRVKVLVRDAEHKLNVSPDFEGEAPRLGQVRKARLRLHRKLDLQHDTAPT